MLLSVGVNDTTSNVSVHKWQQQIEDIINIAQRKFGVRELVFFKFAADGANACNPCPAQ